MDVMVEAVNLKKTYNGFTAVEDVSLQVKRGEIYGFLGPNGAGKTTTINMLIGMSRITQGKVFYDGKDHTKNIKAAQSLIGVVADESNLYDEMSGWENLCFCGGLYGLSGSIRKSRATELMELFGLSEVSSKKFKAYSRGMKRKLTIAAAIIHKPQILFLDEPTTGIDVVSVLQIRELIKRLNKEGSTIFLTTHYIEDAEKLCNRVAFINNGKLIREDTVSGLVESISEASIIDIVIEKKSFDLKFLLNRIKEEFLVEDCVINDDRIRIITGEKFDISPLVAFLSSHDIFIFEAKLIKPTLEDAFVKVTGMDIANLKKEKEKR